MIKYFTTKQEAKIKEAALKAQESTYFRLQGAERDRVMLAITTNAKLSEEDQKSLDNAIARRKAASNEMAVIATTQVTDAKKLLDKTAEENKKNGDKKATDAKESSDKISQIDAARIAEGKKGEAEAIAKRDKNDQDELDAAVTLSEKVKTLGTTSKEQELILQAERDKQEIDALALKSGNTTEILNQAAIAKLAIEDKLAQDIKVITDKTAEDEKKKAEDKAKTDQKARMDNFNNAVEVAKATVALFDFINNGATANDRKRFENNKKLSIANTIINTAAGIGAALTNPISAPFVIPGIVIAGAAQIAKITSTGFASTQTPTTPSLPPAPSNSGGDSNATINSQPSQNFQAGQFYKLGQGSSEAPTQKVVVVETDITKKQKEVAKIEARSTQKI